MNYYIIDSSGRSLFELPYSLDFCFHCLFSLLDSTDERYFLLSVSFCSAVELSSFPCLPLQTF